MINMANKKIWVAYSMDNGPMIAARSKAKLLAEEVAAGTTIKDWVNEDEISLEKIILLD